MLGHHIESNDTESNPGLYRPFNCCHWNVNSFALTRLKKLLIEAYNNNHEYDICMSETYIDSTVAADYKDFLIEL